MNPEQILAHVKRLTSALTPRQLASLVVVFLSVVGIVVGSAYYINTPTYTLLYSDMDADSANAIVTRLKAEKIDYQLDEGGRAIRVPASRIDELRLSLASQSGPGAGRIGFEIFDRTAFGTTEFLEHVNYRRALEGELARTIGTIAEVASARVHIAMAKESLFANDTQPAKASVVLKLRNDRPLAPSTVTAISGLVSASVENLRPESVVIVDTFGRPLTRRPDEDETAADATQLDRQHRVEKDLSTKVVSLLEPVVGEGRVRVNVAARLNGDTEEETEEHWDPETVVRSKQTSSDNGSSAMSVGLAGARANTPTPTANAQNGAAAPTPVLPPPTQTASRTSETTNYEVSKVTRHKIMPRGGIARLSVAVILDDERVAAKGPKGETQVTSKPRSANDIQRIQKLVASSVGIDPDRGDQLTVENIAFGEPIVEEPAPGTWWQRTSPQLLKVGGGGLVEVGRIAGVLMLALFAFTTILKPMARKALDGTARVEISTPVPVTGLAAAGVGVPAGVPAGVKTIADLEGDIEAELEAGVARAGGRRLPVLTRRIAKTAEQEPEHVARLVRSWLTEEDK